VKKYFVVFITYFVSCLPLVAQKAKIDSLQNLLVKTKDDSRKIILFNEMARTYFLPVMLDTVKAKAAMEKMQQLSETGNNQRGKVFGMLRQSSLLRNRKNNDAAIQLLEECQIIAEKNNLLHERAEAMVMKAAAIQAKKKLDDALKLFYNVLPLVTEIRDTAQLMGAYRGLGLCYYSLTSYDSAIHYYTLLQNLSCSTGDFNFCAHSNSMLGIMYSMQSNYAKAIAVNKVALEQYEILGSKEQMANVLNNLANSYRFLGKYEEALQQFYKAIAIREAMGDSGQLASPVFNAADILKITRQYKKANDYYRRSLELSIRNGNKNMQAICYGGMADMFRDDSELDSALAYHLKALELFEATNDKSSIPQSHVSVGQIYLKKKNYSDAISHFQKAKPMLEQAGLKQNLAVLYNEFGNLFSALDSLKDAVSSYEKAYEIADQTRYMEGKLDFSKTLAKIYKRMGDYPKALAYSEIVRATSDSLVQKERIKSMQELTEKYESEKKEQQISLLEKQKQIAQMDISLKQQKINSQELIDREKTNRLALISRDNEIKNLQVIQQSLEIEKQKKESEERKIEMALLQKDNEIKAANELRARQVRNFSLAGVALLVLFGALTFYRYRERKALSEKLAASLTELKETQQQLIETERQREQENVRLRISRDIHDEIGSSLTKIALLSEMASDEMTSNPAEAKESLQNIAEYSRSVNSSLSEIVWAVNPQQDTLGRLLAYMRIYIQNFLEGTSIGYKINFPDEAEGRNLNPELKRSLFLVLKEGINNAVKHSGAKNISVDFSIHGNDFTLKIADDGKGFNTEKNSETGNGISNMIYRAEKCNCRFSISSSDTKGCAIQVSGSLT
jgi:signal transduction histidine kinase